jgi:hypothetical protein
VFTRTGVAQGGKRNGPGREHVHIRDQFVFDGSPIKGAPYSAQATTETTQALADGNRIVESSDGISR